jgi:hypothetical protein
MMEATHLPRGLDIGRPTPSRMRDYILRGRHHFDADVDAAERVLGIVPEIRDTVWAARGFRQRAVAWLAQQGIRQFLDIGCGLPSVGNTHEVAQREQADAHVVYVDPDPLVELFGDLPKSPAGAVGVIRAYPGEPDAVMDHPVVRDLIDPAKPTGLLLTSTMSFIPDSSDPWDLTARYVRRVAPGSYLALSHLTRDAKPPAAVAGCRAVLDTATEHVHFRSKDEIARFFNGLDLVPPYAGARPELAYGGLWGAEDVTLADSEGSRWLYCAVAKIP